MKARCGPVLGLIVVASFLVCNVYADLIMETPALTRDAFTSLTNGSLFGQDSGHWTGATENVTVVTDPAEGKVIKAGVTPEDPPWSYAHYGWTYPGSTIDRVTFSVLIDSDHASFSQNQRVVSLSLGKGGVGGGWMGILNVYYDSSHIGEEFRVYAQTWGPAGNVFSGSFGFNEWATLSLGTKDHYQAVQTNDYWSGWVDDWEDPEGYGPDCFSLDPNILNNGEYIYFKDVGVYHNPEPSTIFMFVSGLFGLGWKLKFRFTK